MKTKKKEKKNSDLYVIGVSLVILIVITVFAINLDKMFAVDVDTSSIDMLNTKNLTLENISGMDEDYKVTVMVFMDYYCPYCFKEFEAVNQLREEYTENVNFLVKHYPTHEGAFEVALASECAKDQDLFWEYSEGVFQSSVKPLTSSHLKQLAIDLGLNAEKFDFCFENMVKYGLVQSHITEGRSLRIQGTPTLYVNNIEFVGYRSVEQVRTAIDNQLGLI